MTGNPLRKCNWLALTLTLAACGGGGPSPTPAEQFSAVSGVVRPAGATPGTTGAAQTIPGEYIVKLRPGLQPQALSSLSAGGVRLQRFTGYSIPGYALLRAADPTAAPRMTQVLRDLRANPNVEYAMPNERREATGMPGDPLVAYKWDYALLNLPQAWAVTTGAPVVVAVIDSGVGAHPDLRGKLLPGIDFIRDPANAGDGDGADFDPSDVAGSSYHGTHVAGIVGATANNREGVAGVSWGARLLPLRVLGRQGGDTFEIMAAAFWGAGGHLDGLPDNPNPVRILNLSLGSTRSCTPFERDIFAQLAAAGVVTVVAAGNDNQDARAFAPASCPHVITVGAVDPTGGRASYSNHGPRIDVMAPGGDDEMLLRVGNTTFAAGVVSTIGVDEAPLYAPYDGTSMAAPQVSGVIALLLSREPSLTPEQVLNRLQATARPLDDRTCGVPGGCGAGLIDVAAVVGAASPRPGPAPELTPVGTVKTLVAAFHLLDEGFDENKSRFVVVEQKGFNNAYRIDGLTRGRYLVGAWQDLNGNGELDRSEPLGAYPEEVVIDQPRSLGNIDIQLKPYQPGAASATASAPGRRVELGAAFRRLHEGK